MWEPCARYVQRNCRFRAFVPMESRRGHRHLLLTLKNRIVSILLPRRQLNIARKFNNACTLNKIDFTVAGDILALFRRSLAFQMYVNALCTRSSLRFRDSRKSRVRISCKENVLNSKWLKWLFAMMILETCLCLNFLKNLPTFPYKIST